MADFVHKNAFEGRLTVTGEHLDALNHVNNVVYLQWVQDISESHWKVFCPAEEREKWWWMVKNHNIHYLRQCRLGDEIILYTWPEPPHGKSSVRHVVMKNAQTGKTVAIAKTEWALIDKASQRPSTCPDSLLVYFQPFI